MEESDAGWFQSILIGVLSTVELLSGMETSYQILSVLRESYNYIDTLAHHLQAFNQTIVSYVERVLLDIGWLKHCDVVPL